jgi:hypothetical protein
MPSLVAEVAFTYATKQLKPGDEFEASEKDAHILKLAKRAKDAVSGETRRSRRYQRRDMTAES